MYTYEITTSDRKFEVKANNETEANTLIRKELKDGEKLIAVSSEDYDAFDRD